MYHLLFATLFLLNSALCSTLTYDYRCDTWTSTNVGKDSGILGRKINRAVIVKEYFAGIVNMNRNQMTKIDQMLDELLYADSLSHGLAHVNDRCYCGAFVARKNAGTNEWLMVRSDDVVIHYHMSNANQLAWTRFGRFSVSKYNSSPGDRISISYLEGNNVTASLALTFH